MWWPGTRRLLEREKLAVAGWRVAEGGGRSGEGQLCNEHWDWGSLGQLIVEEGQ